MLNNVNLIGRLTKDIEIRKTQTGKSVIRFTLAIDKGKEKQADFIECQAWEGRADTIAKYVHKGDIVHIMGELQNSNYERNGEKIYSYIVLVTGFTLLPNAKKEQKEQAPTSMTISDLKADEFFSENSNQNSEYDNLPFY